MLLRVSQRVVKPEILDHLAADDPEARRSRSDLRRINFLMGNERWILRVLRRFPDAVANGVVELGAGRGELAGLIADFWPGVVVAACDLAPQPAELNAKVTWMQGDLLAREKPLRGGVLVANLFLHHFEGESLRALGELCGGFEVVIFNEPDRTLLPHVLGVLMWPAINRVTRHDMHVSISGGFASGEMPDALGLDRNIWHIEETSTWRGARRVLGWRA